jgi:hypothetical protein
MRYIPSSIMQRGSRATICSRGSRERVSACATVSASSPAPYEVSCCTAAHAVLSLAARVARYARATSHRLRRTRPLCVDPHGRSASLPVTPTVRASASSRGSRYAVTSRSSAVRLLWLSIRLLLGPARLELRSLAAQLVHAHPSAQLPVHHRTPARSQPLCVTVCELAQAGSRLASSCSTVASCDSLTAPSSAPHSTTAARWRRAARCTRRTAPSARTTHGAVSMRPRHRQRRLTT